MKKKLNNPTEAILVVVAAHGDNDDNAWQFGFTGLASRSEPQLGQALRDFRSLRGLRHIFRICHPTMHEQLLHIFCWMMQFLRFAHDDASIKK